MVRELTSARRYAPGGDFRLLEAERARQRNRQPLDTAATKRWRSASLNAAAVRSTGIPPRVNRMSLNPARNLLGQHACQLLFAGCHRFHAAKIPRSPVSFTVGNRSTSRVSERGCRMAADDPANIDRHRAGETEVAKSNEPRRVARLVPASTIAHRHIRQGQPRQAGHPGGLDRERHQSGPGWYDRVAELLREAIAVASGAAARIRLATRRQNHSWRCRQYALGVVSPASRRRCGSGRCTGVVKRQRGTAVFQSLQQLPATRRQPCC